MDGNTSQALARHTRSNPFRGFSEFLGGSPHALSTRRTFAWIVRRAPLSSGIVEDSELRRADAPIAVLLAGHDVEMEMRCFLSTEHSVVLEGQAAERPIGRNQYRGEPLGRDHDGPALVVGKREQGRHMPTGDDTTLADFELPRVEHGDCAITLIHDRPSFFAAGHAFTQVARISDGKFDQWPSPDPLAGRRRNPGSKRRRLAFCRSLLARGRWITLSPANHLQLP